MAVFVVDDDDDNDGGGDDDDDEEKEEAAQSFGRFVFGSVQAVDSDDDDEASIRAKAIAQYDAYMKVNWSDKIQNDSWDNPYSFWMDEKIYSLYPILAILAVWLLCIPISTAAVERLFSLAKNILSGKKGGRMGDDTLSILTELKKDIKLKDFLDD